MQVSTLRRGGGGGGGGGIPLALGPELLAISIF